MKTDKRKMPKPEVAKGTRREDATGVWIGARKEGTRVVVSREVTRRHATGDTTAIKSTMVTLPRQAVTGKAGRAGGGSAVWMQSPDLVHQLTRAFEKAVSGAKRRAAKPRG
jgi:hypothetical protein